MALHAPQANPNNDVKGAWCVLAKGQSTPAGAAWDYCQPGCAASRGSGGSSGGSSTPSSSTDPRPLNCAAITGLPAGCTCRQDSYTIMFQGYGTTRTGQGCTFFSEAGTGMCVTTDSGCAATKNNRKGFTCACA